MKRYVIPGIIAALLAVSLLPAPTYTYVVRELAQTFSALQTFSSGLTISAGTFTNDATGTGTGSLHLSGGIGTTAGGRINLEGSAGDSYLLRDVDTGFIRIYLDGTLKATITPRGVIPGACGSDLYAMELGTQCNSSVCGPISVGPDGPLCVSTGVAP